MNEHIKELKYRAEIARLQYQMNHITRDEAKEQIMPYINVINERSKELAKKYNQKPKLVTFITFFR